MGVLSLVSTPIGNMEDISLRAIQTLFTADVIACEDTRRTGHFLTQLRERFPAVVAESGDNRPALIAYYDQVEENVLPELIEELKNGKNVALVSDAGTPLISDPGYRIVQAALVRGIPVTSVPGANAAVTALTVSGMPTDRFLFLGYLPEKQGKRTELLTSCKSMTGSWDRPPTVILYVAPHKLLTTLSDIRAVFGDLSIAIARELTKLHEEVFRGTVTEAEARFTQPLGEMVLLFVPKA